MPEVRVIGADGSQIGIIPTHEALRLAEEQGLAPIGARAQSIEDKLVLGRIAQVASQAKSDAMAAAEQSAGSKAILDELRAAQAEIRRLTLENESLRVRLEILEGGGLAPRM